MSTDTSIPKKAVELVMPAIKKLFEDYAKRAHGFIVVMNPRIKPWEVDDPMDAIWYEEQIVDGEKWDYQYGKIAKYKAFQAWREGCHNIVTVTQAPANLRPGDTFYYGSFNHMGVVVAFSGVEPYFDMLISAWIATAIQALSQHEVERYKADHPDEDFLPK